MPLRQNRVGGVAAANRMKRMHDGCVADHGADGDGDNSERRRGRQCRGEALKI